jgi:YD repeat-containing protein
LLQGHPLAEIEHAGQRYQLRRTATGKLILVK